MADDPRDAAPPQELDPAPDPAEELRAVAAGLRAHLGHTADRGERWAPSGASPRYGVEVPAEHLVGAAPPPDAGAEEPVRQEDPDRRPAPARAAAAPLTGDAAALAHPGLGADGLARVREILGDCQRCGLAGKRTQIVFGQGDPQAKLMFIGEGPGRDEDLQGQAFVGAAGQLLTKMILAMGYEREQVFIANIVKCRPPENRDPEPGEVAACLPFLQGQIRAVDPAVIVTLGRPAAQTLLNTGAPIGKLRGRFQRYRLDDRDYEVMPTFHPAYLLRNDSAKRPVWEDLKQVMARLDQLGPR